MKSKKLIICCIAILLVVCGGISCLLLFNQNNEKKPDNTKEVEKKEKEKNEFIKIAKVIKDEYDTIRSKNFYATQDDDGNIDIYKNDGTKIFHQEQPDYIDEEDYDDTTDEEDDDRFYYNYALLDDYFLLGENYEGDNNDLNNLRITDVYDCDGKALLNNVELYSLDLNHFLGKNAIFDKDFKKIMDLKNINLDAWWHYSVYGNYFFDNNNNNVYDLESKKMVISKAKEFGWFGDLLLAKTKDKTYIINFKNHSIDEDYTLNKCIYTPAEANDGYYTDFYHYCVLKKDNKTYYLTQNQISNGKVNISDNLIADYTKCKSGAKLIDKNNKILIDNCYSEYEYKSDVIIIAHQKDDASVLYKNFEKIDEIYTYYNDRDYIETSTKYYLADGTEVDKKYCDYSSCITLKQQEYFKDIDNLITATCNENDFCMVTTSDGTYDAGVLQSTKYIYYKNKPIFSNIDRASFSDFDNSVKISIIVDSDSEDSKYETYYLDTNKGEIKIDLNNPNNNLEELAKQTKK